MIRRAQSCVLMQEAITFNIFYDGIAFQHLATVLISVFTLCYGTGLLFRGPFCIFNNFLPKIKSFTAYCEKSCTVRQATDDDIIRRMRIAVRTTKARMLAHTIFNTLCFPTAKMVTRTCLIVTLYVYSLPCLHFTFFFTKAAFQKKNLCVTSSGTRVTIWETMHYQFQVFWNVAPCGLLNSYRRFKTS